MVIEFPKQLLEAARKTQVLKDTQQKRLKHRETEKL
jgi:hypothetical protein